MYTIQTLYGCTACVNSITSSVISPSDMNPKSKAKSRPRRSAYASTAMVRPRQLPIRPVVSSAMIPGGYPEKYITQLAYDENVVLTPTVAGALSSVYSFRLNGLYDPNVTGVGVQPLGFDQLCPTVYGFWRVTEVVVDIVATNTLNTSDEVALLISMAYTTPAATDYRVAKSQPNTSIINLGNATGGSGVVRFRRTVSPARVLGMSRSEYLFTPQTVGTNANDPAWSAYLNLQSYSPTAIGTVRLQVQLEYRAEFFFRGFIPGS